MITRRCFATGSLAAGFAALARGARAAPPDMAAFRALNVRVADAHVVPRYRAFAAGAAGLRDALATLAAAPADTAALTAARAGFATAMRAWQGIQHVHFGPIETFSRHQRIQLWPDPRNAIGRALAQALAARAPEPLAPRANAISQVAVQGFPALERLLFEPDAAAKLTAGDGEAAYRAALLRAIGANLAAMAASVVAEWTEGDNAYATTLVGARPPFVKAQEATTELFKALHGAVEIVADRKLTRPLGATPGDARPRLLESWRSGLSGQNIQANLDAAHEMYRAGFAQALEATGDRNLPGLLVRAFDQVLARAGALPLPIEEAIADAARREPVAQLQRDAAALKALLAQRLTAALDIPLGFSALDGD